MIKLSSYRTIELLALVGLKSVYRERVRLFYSSYRLDSQDGSFAIGDEVSLLANVDDDMYVVGQGDIDFYVCTSESYYDTVLSVSGRVVGIRKYMLWDYEPGGEPCETGSEEILSCRPRMKDHDDRDIHGYVIDLEDVAIELRSAASKVSDYDLRRWSRH